MRVHSASLSTKAKPVCLFFIIPIYYELYSWLLVPRHLGNCMSNQQLKNFASSLVYSGQHWPPFSRGAIGFIHTSFVNFFSFFNFSQSPTRTEFSCLSILSKGVSTAMRFLPYLLPGNMHSLLSFPFSCESFSFIPAFLIPLFLTFFASSKSVAAVQLVIQAAPLLGARYQ